MHTDPRVSTGYHGNIADGALKEDYGFMNRKGGHKEEFNHDSGWNEGDFTRIESKVFSDGKSGLDYK
jgi:hypothetical protein